MDDHRMVRETMRRQLVVLGYEVALAGDGQEAVAAYERARRDGTPFDMVVLDRLVEGGWGGEKALSELRRLDSGVKAMLWCGSLDAPSEAYVRQGFGAVLGKPYSLEELRLKVEKILFP
jgi:CheY-like chemotaxis protein